MNFLRQILNGKMFGHPIHMMLIHFPSAFLPMAAILDLISYIYKDSLLALFAFYSACSGIIIGGAALIFGVLDLFKLETQSKQFRIALVHGSLNCIWIFIFTVVAGIQIKFYPNIQAANLALTFIELFSVCGMLYSNFLGGELVLKYGIGKRE